MRHRLLALGLFAIAVIVWWFSNHQLVPALQRAFGFDGIADRDVKVIVGHWIFYQGPTIALLLVVWAVAWQVRVMPSPRALLHARSKQVWRVGAIATLGLLAFTVLGAKAFGAKFGFHPWPAKMIGDVVSNMFEELTYRGLFFCLVYAAVSGAQFPDGKHQRIALVVAALASSALFAFGHGQYNSAQKIGVMIVGLIFVGAFIGARSLWAPWLAHQLGDMVGDTIVSL